MRISTGWLDAVRTSWIEYVHVAPTLVGLELLDEHNWPDRDTLASAIFEWIEAWYNPRRLHNYCRYLSPIGHETAHAA